MKTEQEIRREMRVEVWGKVWDGMRNVMRHEVGDKVGSELWCVVYNEFNDSWHDNLSGISYHNLHNKKLL
jgi:hypothetical protein